MIRFITFPNSFACYRALEQLLRDTLVQPGELMMSGGSTPYAIYNKIAATPAPTVPIHPGRILFLSDERIAPADSKKSNARNLYPMLEALQCVDQFIAVDAQSRPEQACIDYAAALEPFTHPDIGLLGIGTDGHTAGIFDCEQARFDSPEICLHTLRPDGMHGISISPTFLQRIKRIILLAPGDAKRAILHVLKNDPETIPAGIILSSHPNVEVWSDSILSN